MKKLYILSVLLLPLLNTACYDDKGNYDYSELSKIEVSGLEKEYSRISFQDTLHITPTVTSNDKNDVYEYLWTLNQAYDHVPTGGRFDIDTIGTENNLNFPVTLPKGQYDVVLKITNTGTGHSTFHKTTLEVKTAFSLGFYALKEIGGSTDVDLHLPDATIQANLVTKSLGAPILGTPRNIGLIFQYSYMSPELDNYAATTSISICSDKDIKVFSLQDMSLMFSHETLFFGEVPTNETPYYLYPNCYGIAYLSNKGMYFNYQCAIWGMNSVGKFGYPSPIADGCRPNPIGVTSYSGGASMSCFFDEQNRRFIELNFNGDLNAFEKGDTPVPENYNLVFFGRNAIGDDYRGYALFKDQQTPQKHYLYQLGFSISSYENPIIKVGEIPATSKLNTATLYATNEEDVRVMYFVADNQLYMYDIEQQTDVQINPEGLATDEEITYVSNRFWKAANDLPNNFNYLAIATHKNGKYKIHLYNMTGGTPVGMPQRTLKGDGKVVKMQFSSPKMGNNTEDCMYYPGSF